MPKRRTTPSWRGLATKLQKKFEEMGIILPEKDLHLLGDLELLDARCQDLPRWIEGLVVTPSTPEEWDSLASHVGRLWAEVKLLKSEASRIQSPLEVLLSKVNATGDSERRKGQISRAKQRQRGG